MWNSLNAEVSSILFHSSFFSCVNRIVPYRMWFVESVICTACQIPNTKTFQIQQPQTLWHSFRSVQRLHTDIFPFVSFRTFVSYRICTFDRSIWMFNACVFIVDITTTVAVNKYETIIIQTFTLKLSTHGIQIHTSYCRSTYIVDAQRINYWSSTISRSLWVKFRSQAIYSIFHFAFVLIEAFISSLCFYVHHLRVQCAWHSIVFPRYMYSSLNWTFSGSL